MKKAVLAICPALILAVAGCVCAPPPSASNEFESQYARMGSQFDLGQSEREALYHATIAGNADAAWRLSLYQGFFMGDGSKARLWRKRAAELGHAEARKWIDEDRYRLNSDEFQTLYPELRPSQFGSRPDDTWMRELEEEETRRNGEE